MISIICLLPWFLWTVGYPIYKKIKHENVWLIGYAETRKEAWNLLKDDTDIDGSGGWDYAYVQEFINENWDE